MRILVIVSLAFLTACGPSSAQREKIAATQAVVNERIKAGTMTEAEGRLAMAKVRAEVEQERRNGGGGEYRPAVYQTVGGGTVIRY